MLVQCLVDRLQQARDNSGLAGRAGGCVGRTARCLEAGSRVAARVPVRGPHGAGAAHLHARQFQDVAAAAAGSCTSEGRPPRAAAGELSCSSRRRTTLSC